MTEAEKQINLNAGFKLFGGAPHTLVETGREALSEVPEKTDEEIYAQPVEEEEKNPSSKDEEGEENDHKEDQSQLPS